MGVLRTAILGPFYLWCLLISHVIYNTYICTPSDPVTVEEFAKDVTKAQKDALIASRKDFVEELRLALCRKFPEEKMRPR